MQRVTTDRARLGSDAGAHKERDIAPSPLTRKIITYRTDLILNGQSVIGWKAYIAGSPATWECGATEAEAIGRLIITYARAWPERWPGLELTTLPSRPAGTGGEAEKENRGEATDATR